MLKSFLNASGTVAGIFIAGTLSLCFIYDSAKKTATKENPENKGITALMLDNMFEVAGENGQVLKNRASTMTGDYLSERVQSEPVEVEKDYDYYGPMSGEGRSEAYRVYEPQFDYSR